MKILAVLAQQEGQLRKTAFQTATAAVQLAAQTPGSMVTGVIIGNNIAALASQVGAYGIADVAIVESAKFSRFSHAAYAAAIAGAGSSFFAALYGHDQYILDYDTELGQPWANRAVWDKISFFYQVDKITTPTLFMGGEIDWNVPIIGSEEMYEAMKSLGRETELVVYPGEYHGFKTPSHIKDRLERNLAWYAHYVKKDGTPARPAEKK